MSRLISRAESWQQVYFAFQNINFAAFDYNSIKQSIIEYLKLYFPETFNDYIESSEFVAIVETFAYVAELIAYRLDVNAHENFLSTAQRRDSILRLAKLISYTASRPLPARGLVKITSVQTTQTIFDANGINLAGVNVRWNDTSNPDWKNQFLQVINLVLEQQFGSVQPTERFQIEDVLFEIYGVNLIPVTNGVFSYTPNVNGTTVPMELVPVSYNSSSGIVERRPYNNANFTMLYGSDGLGDSSDTTGFFCFTKQGTLQKRVSEFDGVTPNQTFDINVNNINDTDVWVNNIDPNTGTILDSQTNTISYTRPQDVKTGEWQQVDLAHAQNIIFNTNPARNKYEVETRDQNQIRIIFGDGEFADIPSGTFEFWFRTSVDEDLPIPQAAISNQTVSFTYNDTFGQVQTFTFTVSLINSLQNGSAAETNEHVRQTAPSVYYTQDRMVNAEDYNVFMLQDPSILKLRSINRTFSGDSKYIPWHDPSGTYENVKMFSDDGFMYFETRILEELTTTEVNDTELIELYLQPLLSTPSLLLELVRNGVQPQNIRRTFNTFERNQIVAALTPPPIPRSIEMYYNVVENQWYTIKTAANPVVELSTRGYQDLEYGEPIVGSAFAFQTAGLYSMTFTIDGGVIPYVLNFNATLVSTFNDLLNAINVLLTGVATATIEGTYIRVKSSTSGVSSTVSITANTLWSNPPLVTTVGPGTANILPAVNGQDWTDLFITTPLIVATQTSTIQFFYEIAHQATFIIFESPTTQFWQTNEGERVIDYDTLNSNTDKIVVLKANVNYNRNSVLSDNWEYNVLNIESYDSGVDIGLLDYHKISVLPTDVNQDRVPDFLTPADPTNPQGVADFINPKVAFTTSTLGATVPIFYITGLGDVSIIETVDCTATVSEVGLPYTISDKIDVAITPTGPNPVAYVMVKEYVYFNRLTAQEPWQPVVASYETINSWIEDYLAILSDPSTPAFWRRFEGRGELNFAWFHFAPRYYLVDPAPSNIIDTFIINKGYYEEFKRWVEGQSSTRPTVPTPLDLKTSYGYLLDNKMISDTVILHPGRFKLLFGDKSAPELRATFKVITSQNKVLTDNQIKTTIVTVIRNFFNISSWEFGETFFFTELAAAIHAALPTEINSVVLVPTFAANQFGDLFEILASEDEVFFPDVDVNDIEVVAGYTSTNLRLNG